MSSRVEWVGGHVLDEYKGIILRAEWRFLLLNETQASFILHGIIKTFFV